MNFKSEPKYHTVANILRKRIFNGYYPVNTMLPSEKQLQQEFKVGRATIRSAVQLLQKEGSVHIHQGRGTCVLGTIGLQRFENVTSVFETMDGVGLISYDITLTKHTDSDDLTFLRISRNEPVYCLRRLFGGENMIYAYMINYIPYTLAPNIDQILAREDSPYSAIDVYTILNECYGVRYTTSTETLFGSVADEQIAAAMQIEPGTPLICTRRTALSNIRPMECSYTYYVASRYKLIFKMERNYVE